MSMVWKLSYFLGFQIKKKKEGIFISQDKYAKNIVKKFGLDKSPHKRAPVVTHFKITKDSKAESVDNKLYKNMIGSLLYSIASRLDIAYAVGVCARFQYDPRVSHLAVFKELTNMFMVLVSFGILYSYDTNSTLVGYYDADWVNCSEDRKNTSRGCFFLGNNLISWFSKKKNCVSLSTTEAEYIVVGSGCTQRIWMKQMLYEYGIQQDTMTIYCDNMSAIYISKNPVQQNRTKHIDIRHHFIRKLIEENIISLEHV
ncbi:hypothetical protein IC575_004029 [Cucumis melo]